MNASDRKPDPKLPADARCVECGHPKSKHDATAWVGKPGCVAPVVGDCHPLEYCGCTGFR